MHYPEAYMDRLQVKRKERERGLLQIEATYKAQTINIAERLNTKYAECQVLNIVKSHEINQPYRNSSMERTAKLAEELIKSNENRNTKKERVQQIKARLGKFLKKMGQQSNAWPVYYK